MHADNASLLTRSDALFIDFDGTLAELQDNPDTVTLADGMADILTACNDRLEGALALISGRDIDDLAKRTPGNVWRFGNHGLRAAPPGERPTPSPLAAPADLVTQLQDLVGSHAGVRLEQKGPVLAIHYRAAPEAGTWLAKALPGTLEPHADYKLQHGKMVFEAKPKLANKGSCLRLAMMREPFRGRRSVMIGDDTTDEDAFAAAQVAGGIAIKVGEGTTIADHRLSGVPAVHQLLRDFLKS